MAESYNPRSGRKIPEGNNGEVLPANPIKKPDSVVKPTKKGQLTFDAFDKPTNASDTPLSRLSVQRELSGKVVPPSDSEFIRSHHIELKTLQDTIRERVNQYAVGPGDPDVLRLGVFNALKTHHELSRTTQANYAALVRRAKTHFEQGTHTQFISELKKNGILKYDLR